MHHARHTRTMSRLPHLAVSMVVPSKHSARELRASFTYPSTLKINKIIFGFRLVSSSVAAMTPQSTEEAVVRYNTVVYGYDPSTVEQTNSCDSNDPQHKVTTCAKPCFSSPRALSIASSMVNFVCIEEALLLMCTVHDATTHETKPRRRV